MLFIPGTGESEREFLLQLASCEQSYSLARSTEKTLDSVLKDDWGKEGEVWGFLNRNVRISEP